MSKILFRLDNERVYLFTSVPLEIGHFHAGSSSNLKFLASVKPICLWPFGKFHLNRNKIWFFQQN